MNKKYKKNFGCGEKKQSYLTWIHLGSSLKNYCMTSQGHGRTVKDRKWLRNKNAGLSDEFI